MDKKFIEFFYVIVGRKEKKACEEFKLLRKFSRILRADFHPFSIYFLYKRKKNLKSNSSHVQ